VLIPEVFQLPSYRGIYEGLDEVKRPQRWATLFNRFSFRITWYVFCCGCSTVLVALPVKHYHHVTFSMKILDSIISSYQHYHPLSCIILICCSTSVGRYYNRSQKSRVTHRSYFIMPHSPKYNNLMHMDPVSVLQTFVGTIQAPSVVFSGRFDVDTLSLARVKGLCSYKRG